MVRGASSFPLLFQFTSYLGVKRVSSAATVCLALAMYFEGRGEGPVGMVAIGQVVLNRLEAAPLGRWPKDVCGIVMQGGSKPLHRCQFSFSCDGKSDKPRNQSAWQLSLTLSQAMLEGRVGHMALKRATCYYAEWRKSPPAWATSRAYILQEGSHKFYAC